jgi:hypothetical protein
VIDRVGRFFSSLKLTVCILLTLAGVLALGTVYEAENGTPAVRVTFWRSLWFDGLLLTLATNIAGCTYYRTPRRTTRWAYLLLHQSILLIFAGGLIGRWYGREGQLALREGERKEEVTSEASVLNVTWTKAGAPYARYQFATEPIDAFVRRHVVDRTFRMPAQGVSIHVDRFYPDYHEVDGAVEGERGDGAAVEAVFSHGSDTVAYWLFARAAGPVEVASGLAATLAEGRPPATVPPDRLKGTPGGVLELTGPGHSFHRRLDVTGREGAVLPVPGTPYRVQVDRLFTRLTLHGKQPVEDPTAPENPAVLFTLTGPGLTDRRIAFALHPDFDEMHGRKKSGIAARYHFASRELALSRDPGSGRLWVRYHGSLEIVTGPVAPGKSYPIPDFAGLSFSVGRTMPRARPGRESVNRSSELKRPGLHLAVASDVGRQVFWLPFGESRTIAFGAHRATLEYTKVLVPMGFSLTLSRFTVGRHPGTMQPSSFVSDVKMDDPERRVKGDRVITMNEPLVHRGLTFYQSSYVEGTPMTSVFQVAYDPGGPIAYVGFAGFIAGLFCIIWARPPRRPKAGAGSTPPALPDPNDPSLTGRKGGDLA